MDDKDLIQRTRNSLKKKKSDAEIFGSFQKRGYKLAYAEKILAQAKRPKRILTALAISFAIFAIFVAYTIFLGSSKMDLKNPLDGMIIANQNQIDGDGIPITEIDITPEFISYLLNEIGAWKLHQNPLTLEKPIINVKIGTQEFSSKIGKTIETYPRLDTEADLQLHTEKAEVIAMMMAPEPGETIRESIMSGRTKVDVLAGETELFAKGYVNFYESIQ